MENKDFVAFIITHGRPDNVITYRTLERQGYSGPLYLVLDDHDKSIDKYISKFGKEKIVVFNKQEIANTTDQGDNFNDLRTTTHARNACFNIAKELGYTYFVVLDDDYEEFKFRVNHEGKHPVGHFTVKNTLDKVFNSILNYYKSVPFTSIATSQGGDWFGGESNFGKPPKRKCMNSFFCSIERPFKFVSRLNEDVNTYMTLGTIGNLFLTIPLIQLDQKQTQKTSGGMTETYLDNGTYQKSFFTVMYCPSYTKINLMGRTQKRLHHLINWKSAVPVIIDPKYRKL